MSAIAEQNAAVNEFWQPRPAPMSHIAFAKTLTVPDSEDENGVPDPYDPSSHAGQRIFLEALDGRYDAPGARFRVFVFIGDAQGAGKSWVLQQTAFHDLVERGQNVIYALPTRDLGGDIWSLKLRPAIIGAGLEAFLPETGQGSRGGAKPRFIPFLRQNGRGGGTLVFMAAGGRGQSGQAALTSRKLIVDEVEDWQPQPLSLIRKRISRNNQTALQLYACTINKNNSKIKEDDNSRILPLYNDSTRGRVGYPCPHCHKTTRLEPERFQYQGTSKAEWEGSAMVVCEHCDVGLGETQRKEALASGELVCEDANADSFGLRLTALDCPWKPLHWLAEEHYKAARSADMGDYEPMRQFFNKEWSLQYRADEESDENAQKVDPKFLMRRSLASTWGPTKHETDREGEDRTYSRHIAPLPECEWLTLSVDVQANRCYWLLVGGDKLNRTWDVAWGYEHATKQREEMDKGQLHDVLSRIDAVTREIAGDMPIVRRGVDTNYRTDDVVNWLETHLEWWPVYGASAKKAMRMQKAGERINDYPGVLYQRRSPGWKLRQHRVHIDTTPVRLAAQRSFLLEQNAPGAAHVPNGLQANASDRTYLEHLCAEQWNERELKWERERGSGRWDWLDCRTYCIALHKYHLLTLTGKKPPKRTYGELGTIGGRQ